MEASRSRPAVSCPLSIDLVWASGVKNRSVPRPEVETEKQTKLNKISNLGMLCICSNMCCYPESLKPLLDETTGVFTDDGSRSGHFLLLYPTLKSGDQTQRHDLFSNVVNIYNLHFLGDGACLFPHFRTCPGKWWLLSSWRGKRALFSYCSLITPALLEALSKSKKDS